MSYGKETKRKKVRNAIISIIVGGVIVWLLLPKINPRDIPRAVGNIPLMLLVFSC